MRKWRKGGKSITTNMGLTGRSKDSVRKRSNPKCTPGVGSGRKKIITPTVYKKLATTMVRIHKKAHAFKEVRVAMVKAQANVEASDRTVLDEFHKHDVWFRPLRQKPILTDDDIVTRDTFGHHNLTRSEEGWVDTPNAIIDNKNFLVYMKSED